jgi:hypothetical protein
MCGALGGGWGCCRVVWVVAGLHLWQCGRGGSRGSTCCQEVRFIGWRVHEGGVAWGCRGNFGRQEVKGVRVLWFLKARSRGVLFRSVL